MSSSIGLRSAMSVGFGANLKLDLVQFAPQIKVAWRWGPNWQDMMRISSFNQILFVLGDYERF